MTNPESTSQDEKASLSGRDLVVQAPGFDMHGHLGWFCDDDGDPDGSMAALKKGGWGGCVAAAIADRPVIERTDQGMKCVREPNQGELFASTSRQLDRLDAVMHRHQLQAVRASRAVRDASAEGTPSILVGIEGADFLEREIDGVEWAHGRGVRLIQLVHYRINALGDIQTEEPRYGGLTAFGAEVVNEMDRLSMIIDVAHAPFSVARGVAERTKNPIICSHTLLGNAHPRCISEDYAKVVAETGGVIGAWPSTLAVNSMDEYVTGICKLAETVTPWHVGIGTDMSISRSVFTDYAKSADLVEALRKAGMADNEIEGILGGNFMRVIERVVSGSFLRAYEEIAVG